MESQANNFDSVPLPSCQICGRQDETLRLVSYPYVISVLVMTFSRSFSGLWCKKHRRRYLFLSSLITSCLGWLGFPFGIIYTPVALFKLARGGNSDPQLNFQLLTTLAEHKLQSHHLQGAIDCFEESLRFQDSPEIRQKLLRLHQQYRADTKQGLLATVTPAIAVPILFSVATISGLAIGIFDMVTVYLLAPFFGSTESIFVVILSWLPLVVMIFLEILLLRSGTEWALKNIHSVNKSLSLALAIFASAFAFYGVLEGRAIISSLPSAFISYSYSINDVIFSTRAILAYGGILELINFYQVHQAFGLIYLVLFSVGAVCALYVAVTTASETTRWQSQLAEIRRSLTADSDHPSTLSWIWLIGMVSVTVLLAVIVSPGRFVNIEKANQHLDNAGFAADNNRVEEAIPEFEQAIAIWPETVRGHAALGLIYLGQEKYDLAASETETALRLDPNSMIVHFMKAFISTYQLAFERAIEHLNIVISSQPTWGTPHAYLALLYYQTDQTDLMQMEIESALAYEEGDGQASFLIGAYYFGMQDYAASEKHLLKAVEMPSATAQDYFFLARLYAVEKKFELAEDAIRKAAGLDAEETDVHLARAHLLRSREDLAGALSEILEALKSSPNDSETHSDLSYVYFLQGRIDEAAKEAELAIVNNPYNADAYVEQAFAYQAQGKLVEALAAAQKAVASSPKTDRAHFVLGLCYMERGMKEEAIHEFEEFLDLYWERPYVRQNKEDAEKYLVELQK